jgi:hypothetical protein
MDGKTLSIAFVCVVLTLLVPILVGATARMLYELALIGWRSGD